MNSSGSLSNQIDSLHRYLPQIIISITVAINLFHHIKVSILERRITISDLPLGPNWRIVRDSTDFNQIVITAYCGPLHATSATIAIEALHLSKYLDDVTLVELQNQIVVINAVSH